MATLNSRINPSVTSDNLDTTLRIVVADSATESTVIEGIAYSPTALYFPSTWTSCNITFKAQKSLDGTPSFYDVCDFTGTQISIATAANMRIPLDPAIFNSIFTFKIVCSVSQAADRIVNVDFGPVFGSL